MNFLYNTDEVIILRSVLLNALRLPLPKEQLGSVKDIDTERLARLGIDTILFDFDNTLTPWRNKLVDDSIKEVIRGLIEKGFKVAIVTNAGRKRMEEVDLGDDLPLPVFHSLFKPGVKRLKQVLRKIGAVPEKTAMVGDLFFTDIIAGNRLGMYTILVNPYIHGATDFVNKLLGVLTKVFFFSFYYTIGWFFHIVDLTTPNEAFKDVYSIDYERLIKAGFDTFVFDYDNTLSPWKTPPSNEVVRLLNSLAERGVMVIIASNGKRERLERFKRFFGDKIVVIGSARKPMGGRVKRLLKKLGRDPNRTVVIGDQLFTDVFMGSLIKAYTIKVEPIDEDREFLTTRFLRRLEKIVKSLQRGKHVVWRKEE